MEAIAVRVEVSGSSLARYATPTGSPCPRTIRVDGTVEGAGACFGCGTCLLFGGLVNIEEALTAGASAAALPKVLPVSRFDDVLTCAVSSSNPRDATG
jgi:hypothetical protein